jgi:hypothetical protein
MTKWNVVIGERTESASGDLLSMIGFSQPYSNDAENKARDDSYNGYAFRLFAEAVACGHAGDQAAMYAIRTMQERTAAQSLETARQKVAELSRAEAADRAKAAGIEYATLKLRLQPRD